MEVDEPFIIGYIWFTLNNDIPMMMYIDIMIIASYQCKLLFVSMMIKGLYYYIYIYNLIHIWYSYDIPSDIPKIRPLSKWRLCEGAMLLRPALRTPPGSDQPLLFPRVVFRRAMWSLGSSMGNPKIRWNLWEYHRIYWDLMGHPMKSMGFMGDWIGFNGT
jgi:hypothetical protein